MAPRNLNLTRPLVVFDLETTGTDPGTDRIVEIAILRLEPDGTRTVRSRRINPERPIPRGATAVHGITDDDVRDEPTFRKVARSLLDLLEGADLAGFNVQRFDLPLLAREFSDCGLDLGATRRHVIDVMTIFHRMERRDLTAAVRFYLDRDHEGAHGATADAEATAEVLEAQLERYPDLPREVDRLHDWGAARPGAVDRAGKLVWNAGEATLAFGKHQGKSLRQMASEAPDYLQWIVGSDFPSDAKEIVRRALAGEFPQPPGGGAAEPGSAADAQST